MVQNQEPLELVLHNYNIKVAGIKNESYKEKKGVWWINTPVGNKILKKISNSEDTLKHILHAVGHLKKNGILIPDIIKTTNNSDYVNINGTCYVLWDAVEGKNPSYSSPAELQIIISSLARFHKASEGFSPAPGTKPKCHLGTWIEDYTEQIEDMYGFYEKESGSESNPIGKTVIREFPYFYERAKKAIEGLKGREYADWIDKAGRKGCLCHQDFAAGNLIMVQAGDLYIIDTDSLTIDIPARDIRKIINKIMKKQGKWDTELIKRIISCYQSQNPLSHDEWQVVKLDLMFPHLFIGAMNKYYYKRDKEWSDDKYHKRLKEMAEFEKTSEPVLEAFESIKP